MFDLKAFRKDNNITQIAAADLFGCKQSFISDIERGRRTIPDAYIDILCEKYGTDINDYFITNNTPTVNIEKATVGSVMQGDHNKHKGNINIASEQAAVYETKLDEANAEIERLKSELAKAKDKIIDLQQKLIDRL